MVVSASKFPMPSKNGEWASNPNDVPVAHAIAKIPKVPKATLRNFPRGGGVGMVMLFVNPRTCMIPKLLNTMNAKFAINSKGMHHCCTYNQDVGNRQQSLRSPMKPIDLRVRKWVHIGTRERGL
jgi:hypothetical protein